MIATRNYAYANIAAYETMVAGNPHFKVFQDRLNICLLCRSLRQEKR
jgi:hypothetical protein